MKASLINMKVLVVSHMYPSTFNKMAGIFVHQQVKALIKCGCEVKVVSPVPFSFFPLTKVSSRWKAYYEIPKKTVIDGVELFYPRYIEFPKGLFFENSGYFMYLGIKNTIENIYKEFPFDVIHSHVALPDGFAATLVNKKYSVPHITTVHGQDLQNTIYKNRKCRENLFKTFYSASSIITVSKKLKEVVRNEDFYNKITVINNGINLDEIEDYAKESELTKEENTFLIVSASNLIKSKGIDLNIKAISRLIKRYPFIQYFIIGDGEERERLESLVNEVGLSRNIKFLGKLSHKDVIKYMHISDLYSMPSWQEGFGMVYIEAMACRKPVIAVKGEGIEDAVSNGENGLLVAPNNIDEIEKSIEFIINNSEKVAKIKENARKKIENNFTWDINAKRTIELYETNIANKRKNNNMN